LRALLRRAERFAGLRLVEIGAADRRVGEHGDHLRLHLEDAAGDEDQLLRATACGRDPHSTRLDARDERRVAGVYAKLSRFAGQHDELRLAGEDGLFALTTSTWMVVAAMVT
jgi:hypothetical protein